MIPTLAISDLGAIFIGGSLQLVFNLTVAVLLWQMRKRGDYVTELEHSIEEKSKQIVEAKIAEVENRIDGRLQRISDWMGQINDRLQSGDRQLEHLDEKDHQAQLALTKSIAEMRAFVYERAATKEDVEKVWRKLDEMRDACRIGGNSQ